jgi:hypothetical protein
MTTEGKSGLHSGKEILPVGQIGTMEIICLRFCGARFSAKMALDFVLDASFSTKTPPFKAFPGLTQTRVSGWMRHATTGALPGTKSALMWKKSLPGRR